MVKIIRDPRIPQVRKIISSIIGKKDQMFTKIMITRDNTLVIILYDTTIYVTKLIDEIPGFELAFYYSDIINLEDDQCIVNHILYREINDKFTYFANIEYNSQLLSSNLTLRGNEEFERLLALKSADGAELYKMYGNNPGEVYFVPIFSGFPNLNKDDQIGINIYYFDQTTLMNVMYIYKKKIKRDIKIYFRTLRIN